MSDTLSDRPGDKTALSLNLSSLSVTSPTNLSPINPSPHPSTHASSHVSPITPISPSGNSLVAHHHPHHAHHPHIQQPFQFAAPDHGEPPPARTPTSANWEAPVNISAESAHVCATLSPAATAIAPNDSP